VLFSTERIIYFMAKDFTNRGGARTGAGRKPYPGQN